MIFIFNEKSPLKSTVGLNIRAQTSCKHGNLKLNWSTFNFPLNLKYIDVHQSAWEPLSKADLLFFWRNIIPGLHCWAFNRLIVRQQWNKLYWNNAEWRNFSKMIPGHGIKLINGHYICALNQLHQRWMNGYSLFFLPSNVHSGESRRKLN